MLEHSKTICYKEEVIQADLNSATSHENQLKSGEGDGLDLLVCSQALTWKLGKSNTEVKLNKDCVPDSVKCTVTV